VGCNLCFLLLQGLPQAAAAFQLTNAAGASPSAQTLDQALPGLIPVLQLPTAARSKEGGNEIAGEAQYILCVPSIGRWIRVNGKCGQVFTPCANPYMQASKMD